MHDPITRRLPTIAALATVAAIGAACEQPVPEPVEVVRPIKMLTI